MNPKIYCTMNIGPIPIKDFTSTGSYAQHKLKFPDKTAYELAKYDMDHVYEKYGNSYVNHKKNLYFLKDSHTFHVDNKINLYYFSHDPTFSDGIYDIWLHNCNNVTSITMTISSIGKVFEISRSEKEANEDVQIPLFFYCDKDKYVDHFLFEHMGFFGRTWETSFLPINAIYKEDITIELNDGATADLKLSTLYINPKAFLRDEVNFYSDIIFYINGKQFKVSNGKCYDMEKIPVKHSWMQSILRLIDTLS